MKRPAELPLAIEKYGSSMSGIFTRSDLANLFGNESGITLSNRIQRMIEDGFLKRAIRSVYFDEKATLEALAQRIFPEGYISLSTALSLQSMIGTRPSRTVDIITTRSRPKVFETDLGKIKMRIKNRSYIPQTERINKLTVATKEQAFIDTCYFACRGIRLPFNLYSDVDIKLLSKSKIKKMICEYKNERFKKFVETLLAEYNG